MCPQGVTKIIHSSQALIFRGGASKADARILALIGEAFGSVCRAFKYLQIRAIMPFNYDSNILTSIRMYLYTEEEQAGTNLAFDGAGCRSFSVQSNMRRHARVHTRATDAQASGQDVDEEDEESESLSATRSTSHSRGHSGSSANHSQGSSRG